MITDSFNYTRSEQSLGRERGFGVGKRRVINVIQFVFAIAICVCTVACTTEKPQEMRSEFFDILDSPVGTVNFPNTCNGDAEQLVERGVALLHHMMYREAAFLFDTAQSEDDGCAMAKWGKAMTMIQPLWPDGPSDKELKSGLAMVQKALAKDDLTEREKAYLNTVFSYFDNAQNTAIPDRLKKFESAWEQVNEAFPQDYEARAFLALSMIATSDKRDQTYSKQQQAADVAKSVYSQNSAHPGALHYIIHAYDLPGLAVQAAPYVKRYGEITPKVPHAAHMLSHIYTRLGDWRQSAFWNSVSSESAWELCVASGEVNIHFTHAQDYLAYAYLQMGDDSEAQKILSNLGSLKAPYTRINHASAYSFAAVPARYAAEREDWDFAITLQPRTPSDFPWADSHLPYVAITHFVRAIGFAKLQRPKDAESDIAKLMELRDSVQSTHSYWANQIDIKLMAAQAWQLYASGETEAGLAKMLATANKEMATQKHPITPGAIIPAYELYASMLLETGQYKEAISAYERSLERSPNRLNSLIGLSYAATRANDRDAAQKYMQQVAELTGDKHVERRYLNELSKLSSLI